MEKERLSYRTHILPGTSLKELVPYAIKRHKGNPGQPISERVRWLSHAIESETFWMQLNYHIANDEGKKRQSVGGLFSGEYGKKQMDYCSWKELFSSLDLFLKEFDMRATEFLFRDFQPQNPNINLARIIDATRELSIEKYPRLRRLYWNDYEKTLETTTFWYRLSSDLAKLPKPISTQAFFLAPSKLNEKERLGSRRRQLEMRTTLRQPLWTIHGSLGKKVGFIEYQNLDQITRDLFNQDPRTFLLDYQQKSNDKFLDTAIKEAKMLLEQKIFPIRPKPEVMTKLTKTEFNKLINSKEFWLSLSDDLESHFNSQNPTYSFSFFLRHYDKNINEINLAKVGTYARLATTDIYELKNLRKKLIKPSKNLAQYLMWEFAPAEDLSPEVIRVKELCAGLFPQDCLYVRLQTPSFWKDFEADINSMQGNHTLASFLRYFSGKNPNCDHRLHHRNESRYQLLLHRAYHKKKGFLKFLSSIGIKEVSDHKDGLTKLFLYTAPPKMREILLKKFPKDFNLTSKIQQEESKKLLEKAKSVVRALKPSGEFQELHFDDKTEALNFRIKLQIASRSLKVSIITSLEKNIVKVKIGKRFKFPKEERTLFEEKVKNLKLEGMANKEIAKEIGGETKDHDIEYVVGKLRKKGELSPSKRISLSVPGGN